MDLRERRAGCRSRVSRRATARRSAVQVVATGLQIPWSLAFAPDGRLFITERPGRVRIFANGQLQAAPALALSDVFTSGESGVLGLALHPDFATNHLVYLTYTANGADGPVARLVRFREAGNQLVEPVVLLDDVPAADIHNGSRVKFGPDRLLVCHLRRRRGAVQRSGRRVAERQNPPTERRRDERCGQSLQLTGLFIRASQSSRARLASDDARSVGNRARKCRQRRDQRDRIGRELRLAGHRG